MIEPQDAYTVPRRMVMPPKFEHIMPMSRLSMEEDAKLCNQRMWASHERATCGGSAAQKINISRHRQAVAEREDLAVKVLAIIAKRPVTTEDLRKLLHITNNRIRAVLGMLKTQDRVYFYRKNGFAYWTLTDQGTA